MSKQSTTDIVATLFTQMQAPLSGEKIAQNLGLSRTAIWKAIKNLRERGYSIYGSPKLGYTLVSVPDILNKDEIMAQLSPQSKQYIGDKLEIFTKLDSTNNEAKRRLSLATNQHEINGTVLVANQQTAGRGRMGRSFFSPEHTGLYFTLIISNLTILKTLDTSLVTAFVAVAITRALDDFGVKSNIKWVNDIFIDTKKVCGILTEGIINMETGRISAFIVGIGVNVKDSLFPDDLQHIAGSVNNADLTRNALLSSILNHLFLVFLAKETDVIMQEYKTRSFLIGKKIQVIDANQNYEAFVVDITPQAHLVVKTDNGELKTLVSGEVRIVI